MWPEHMGLGAGGGALQEQMGKGAKQDQNSAKAGTRSCIHDAASNSAGWGLTSKEEALLEKTGENCSTAS